MFIRVDDNLLVDVTKYIDVATVEDVGAEHASCDDMRSGYESDFCMDVLYLITAKYSSERRLRFHGWSYACERHLTKLVLEFALRMEVMHLDVQFDEWNDDQVELEKQLPLRCPVCNGEGEHDWEIHTAEMRASAEY